MNVAAFAVGVGVGAVVCHVCDVEDPVGGVLVATFAGFVAVLLCEVHDAHAARRQAEDDHRYEAEERLAARVRELEAGTTDRDRRGTTGDEAPAA